MSRQANLFLYREPSSKLIYLGFLGGLLMALGVVAMLFGFTIVGGLVLITLGGLLVAIFVFTPYKNGNSFDGIPSVTGSLREDTPWSADDQDSLNDCRHSMIDDYQDILPGNRLSANVDYQERLSGHRHSTSTNYQECRSSSRHSTSSEDLHQALLSPEEVADIAIHEDPFDNDSAPSAPSIYSRDEPPSYEELFGND